ncbi:MAG: cyclic nucleotide-binding domain-containing protein [Syntrophobacteraceae bacterium]|nr:cyclic nucleotide-binding domain-containing protein [Syntrophobacteraceae bacterium]
MPLLDSLSRDELQRVAQTGTRRSYPAGGFIFTQGGSRLECVYVVQSGEVELYHQREVEKHPIRTFKEREIFGVISVLMNAGIPLLTARAVRDVVCYTVPADVFLDLCRTHKSLNRHFMDVFGRLMVNKSFAALFTPSQACQFLPGIIPFSFLPERENEKIASEVSLVFYPRGSVLFTQGVSRVEHLYVIWSGAVERYFEQTNEKTLSTLMSEGEVFGGISMLINHGISIRSLRTIEDAYFYILPKHCFLDICNRYEQFLEYFTDTFGKRMLDSSYAAIVARTMQPNEESLQFLNKLIDSICQKNLHVCEEGLSIRTAAQLMSDHKCSSILVKSHSNDIVGIVTDNDLTRKVIAGGLDTNTPVGHIMSSPIKTVSSQALVFEALMAMMQDNIKHLGVTDSGDRLIGIVTNKDILTAQSHSPVFLIRGIADALTVAELKEHYELLPGVIQGLISSGASSKNLTRLITTISDAIFKRVVEFAIRDHGEPPCGFAFMVLGSEGRKEQTLKTDQDNAIVFEDIPAETVEAVRAYFLRLGETVCTGLNEVGFDFCPGEIMARNPKWCQPISVWKNTFLTWMRAAEPDDLLQSTIFFDFRCGFGHQELVDELRGFLMESLSEWSFFFRHMAENAQLFKPPIGFFRNFIVESKGDHRDSFDIKKAMVPVVDFARIFALKHRIAETNTQERLHQLYLTKKIQWETFNEIDHAYGFLMQLRFLRQIHAVVIDKTKPDNYINPKKLTRIEQTMLKEVFARIANLQNEMGSWLFGT